MIALLLLAQGLPAPEARPSYPVAAELVAAIEAGNAKAVTAIAGDRIAWRLYGPDTRRTDAQELVAKLKGCKILRSRRMEAKGVLTEWACENLDRLDKACEVPGYYVELRWNAGPYVVGFQDADVMTGARCNLAPPPLSSIGSSRLPPVADRFLAAVKAGTDLGATEFADAVRSGDSEEFRSVSDCKPIAVARDAVQMVVIQWICEAGKGASGFGTVLHLGNGKITEVVVMSGGKKQ